MGRSVATPRNATATVYLNISDDVDYDTGDFDWDWFVDDIRTVLKERYHTLEDEIGWVEGELQVILENGHARVMIADYCGLVSVSIVPLHNEGFSKNWCQRIEQSFYEHMAYRYPESLVRDGTMSNGVSIYRSLETSLQEA